MYDSHDDDDNIIGMFFRSHRSDDNMCEWWDANILFGGIMCGYLVIRNYRKTFYFFNVCGCCKSALERT